MVSFVNYVLRFKNDDSAIGDVARDMAVDPAISKKWGYLTLIKHLLRMNAVERVYEILANARTGYILDRIFIVKLDLN